MMSKRVMNISDFWYTRLMAELIEEKTELIRYKNEEIRRLNSRNTNEKPIKTLPFYPAKIHMEAFREVQQTITDLKMGNSNDVDIAKTLELEIAFIRKNDKDKLVHRVESKLGFSGDEAFTLEEIGKTFGVTRERVRQIEDSANKKMRHPDIRRTMREATYA